MSNHSNKAVLGADSALPGSVVTVSVGASAATEPSVLSERENRELILCVLCCTRCGQCYRMMVTMTFDGDFEAVVNDEEQVIR